MSPVSSKESAGLKIYDTRTNPVNIDNTTDGERANHLQEFCNNLRNEGWSDIHLMPLNENERGPVIKGQCRLDSNEALSHLVTPEEAAQRIRDDGVRGFYVYCDKESHGTEELVILDRDEPGRWCDTPETLQVISGSGESDHLYYRNDGTVERAKAKGDLKGAGSVQGKNWGVVVPGSIHHGGSGIYHVSENPGVATLSSSDLTPSLLPSSGGTEDGSHSYGQLDEPDEDAVETVQKAIVTFRTNTETSRKAVEYFQDLRAGRNLRDHGFYSSENEKGCRHEANLSLASKLHGMLLMDGEADRDRNKRLIHHYLSWVVQQNKYETTDLGQRRKLLVSEKYIRDTVSTAVETFEHEYFNKWTRKTEEHNFTGEYSELTKQVVIESLEVNAEVGKYPTRAEVVEGCKMIDQNPRKERTYQECLRRMVGRKVKKAHLGGNDYRYYPFGVEDPEGAESVEGSGWV